MVRRGPQILSQSQNIDRRGAQVHHGLVNLSIALAQAQHQTGLGEDRCSMSLRRAQHADGLLVAGARIAHRMSQPPDRLHVLREYIQPRIEDGVHIAQDALEIRCQRLDGGSGLRRLMARIAAA